MPTAQEWAQKAEQWVPAFLAEHSEITSADALYSQMQASDMYVPRSYVREEWGRRKDEVAYVDIIQRMPGDTVIPGGWMRETSMNYREKYIWKVTITGIDAQTGRPVERTVTIEGDENEDIDTILDAGWGWAASYGLDLYANPPTVTIAEAMIKV